MDRSNISVGSAGNRKSVWAKQEQHGAGPQRVHVVLCTGPDSGGMAGRPLRPQASSHLNHVLVVNRSHADGSRARVGLAVCRSISSRTRRSRRISRGEPRDAALVSEIGAGASRAPAFFQPLCRGGDALRRWEHHAGFRLAGDLLHIWLARSDLVRGVPVLLSQPSRRARAGQSS